MGLTERLLALTQALLGLLPRGHVSRRTKPLANIAVGIEQRDCPREGPAPATIHTPHAMLELKYTLGANCLLNGGHDMRLIVGMDVLVEPAPTRVLGIGNKVSALEETHLAPIGTHLVDDFRCRAHQRMKPLLIREAYPHQLEPRADEIGR